jgi:uncharacterized protein YejL (UPF0352 family)
MADQEKNLKQHWNNFYSDRAVEELGWYEKYPAETISMVEKCDLSPESSILVVGAGSSTLIDCLLEMDFKNIIASDLSQNSLESSFNHVYTNPSGSARPYVYALFRKSAV